MALVPFLHVGDLTGHDSAALLQGVRKALQDLPQTPGIPGSAFFWFSSASLQLGHMAFSVYNPSSFRESVISESPLLGFAVTLVLDDPWCLGDRSLP